MGKKSVSKGHLIDEHCKYTDGALVDNKGSVYTCMLNQTDIKSNKNKFYTMQLIKTGSKFVHFIRYGRIGDPGKISYKDFASMESAISSFEKQFRSKTGNRWIDKNNFKIKDGKYFLTEVSYEDELKNVDDVDRKDIPKSVLPKRVQDLIKMISDVDMLKNALVELDIDPEKMPLGKINKTQIDKAKKIIDQIEKKLDEKGILEKDKDDTDSEALMLMIDEDIIDLCSKYYTYIPYNCGRKKPPIIKRKKMIDKYRSTLTDLMDIAIGIQIINDIKADENPLDSVYKSINTNIKPLRKNTKIWKEIDTYVTNTHGPTHNCKLRLMDIFEVEQEGKRKEFDEYCKNIGNRKLLFHGSGMSNWMSILKHGLLINPQTVDNSVFISGKMFANGIYYANCISKSWNYCRTNESNGIGCLAISEVALGNVSKRIHADYNITKQSLKNNGYESVHGLGKNTPESSFQYKGVSIPNGKLIKSNVGAYLLYDEFIVYETNQQLIKYLVIVENKKY